MTDEPTVRLSNGRDVLECVFDSIRELQARGHQVRVVADAVIIVPPIGSDWTEVLNQQPQDVADILNEAAR